MYYKNYWVNYVDFQDNIMCIVSDIDFTDFKNTSKDHDYNHFKTCFFIDRKKYENCRKYLNEKGLFLGIFPPELIEEDIENYKIKQNKRRENLLTKVKEKYKKPLPEEFFENLALHKLELPEVYREIEISNLMSKEYWGIEFPIEEYYMKYLLKYWRIKILW